MHRIAIVWTTLAAAVALFFSGGALADPVAPSTVAPAAGGNLPEMPEMKEAVDRFNKRDYEGALAALEVAAKKRPDLPPAPTFISQFFGAAGQSQMAQAMLERAAQQYPDDPEAYLMLGDYAFGAGRILEANLLFEKAGELVKAYEGDKTRKGTMTKKVHAGKASTAEARRDWKTARAEIEAWLKIDSDNTLAHHRLGLVLFHENPKKADAALAQLEIAAKGDAKLPPAPVTMMQLWESVGDREQAKNWAKLAIAKSPDSLPTQLGVARWMLATDQLDEASKRAEAATKVDSGSLEAKIIRGLVARFRKKYDEAEEWLERAKVQTPADFAANDQLALVLIESDDPAKRSRAQELAELNAKNNPQRVDAFWTLGWVSLRDGKLKDARELLQRARMATPNLTSEQAYYMAKLANELGEAPQVKRFLEIAVTNSGPFPFRAEAQKWLEEISKEDAK